MRKYGKGWYGESRRHSLARLGIKTANYAKKSKRLSQSDAYKKIYDKVRKKSVNPTEREFLFSAKSRKFYRKLGDGYRGYWGSSRSKSYPNYSSVFDSRDYGILSELSSPPISRSKLSKQERKTLNTSISKVKSLLKKRGKSINFTDKNLQIVQRVGPDDTAFGAHQGDLIQIDRDTLKDQDKTEGVLLHECIHKIYGVRDETRELENLQIDYLGELM